MRIGINATILNNKPTGLGIFTTNIIKELSVLINDKDSLVVYTSTPEVFDSSLITTKKVSSVVQPSKGKKGGIMRFLWSQFIFPFRLKKDNVDVLYSTTHHGVLLNSLKQIITVHDVLPLKFQHQYRLQYYYFKYILPKLIQSSKMLITVSNNTKMDLMNYYNFPQEFIGVIYNSFDKKHFHKIDCNKFKKEMGEYILFLGATFPHKNLIRTIQAFNDSTACSKYKLVVTGGNPNYINQVKEQFSEVELQLVYFLDYVDYKDLPILYSNAVCLIYPSLYEGFGIPPLEAMASGCPVISSNTSSIPEVCQEASLYFDPEKIDEITNAINKITQDSNLRAELVKKGLNRVKDFSWKKSAEDLLEIIKRI